MYTNFFRVINYLWKVSIEIVINQVELKLGNTKIADKIKLKLMII